MTKLKPREMTEVTHSHERVGMSPMSGDPKTPAHTPMTPWEEGHLHHLRSSQPHLHKLPAALQRFAGFLLPGVHPNPGPRLSPNSPANSLLKISQCPLPTVFRKRQPPQGTIRVPLQPLFCPPLQPHVCASKNSLFLLHLESSRMLSPSLGIPWLLFPPTLGFENLYLSLKT